MIYNAYIYNYNYKYYVYRLRGWEYIDMFFFYRWQSNRTSPQISEVEWRGIPGFQTLATWTLGCGRATSQRKNFGKMMAMAAEITTWKCSFSYKDI